MPDSVWQACSSFANTDGGTLLLGVRETNGHFSIEGLTDSQLDRYQRDFWNTLNNKNKVSSNILLNHHEAECGNRREKDPAYRCSAGKA